MECASTLAELFPDQIASEFLNAMTTGDPLIAGKSRFEFRNLRLTAGACFFHELTAGTWLFHEVLQHWIKHLQRRFLPLALGQTEVGWRRLSAEQEG